MPEVPASPAPVKAAKSSGENKPANAASESSPGPEAVKKPRTKINNLIYVVAAVAVAAAAVYFWPRPQGSTNTASSAASESTLPLDTFIVNLDGRGQRAYLRIGITLGLSHPLNKKKDDTPVALVRDTILSVLASAQPEALLSAEGKQKLKADILKALQESAPDLGVNNVYFTEFLVQM